MSNHSVPRSDSANKTPKLTKAQIKALTEIRDGVIKFGRGKSAMMNRLGKYYDLDHAYYPAKVILTDAGRDALNAALVPPAPTAAAAPEPTPPAAAQITFVAGQRVYSDFDDEYGIVEGMDSRDAKFVYVTLPHNNLTNISCRRAVSDIKAVRATSDAAPHGAGGGGADDGSLPPAHLFVLLNAAKKADDPTPFRFSEIVQRIDVAFVAADDKKIGSEYDLEFANLICDALSDAQYLANEVKRLVSELKAVRNDR